MDDPQRREVFKQVCRWNIVSKNFIPIIEHWQHYLVLNAVKALVFLSMPIELSSSDILQQIKYLWNMKVSLTSSEGVAVTVSLLEGPFENLEWRVQMPRLSLMVSSPSWKRKQRKEGLQDSTILVTIHSLGEHLDGLLWYVVSLSLTSLILCRSCINKFYD